MTISPVELPTPRDINASENLLAAGLAVSVLIPWSLIFPMSQSPGPYKSQLFSTLNRQSRRWRDRLGTTVRQIKVAAEWGVQALIYPFYWLLHPQKWLGPVFAPRSPSAAPALPAPPTDGDQDHQNKTRSSTLADRPIEAVLTTVQPWLLATDSSPDIPLTDNVEEYLRESLRLCNPAPSGSQPALPQRTSGPVTPSTDAITLFLRPGATTAPSSLGHGGKPVNSLGQRPTVTLIIQGIACRCSDRRLVLTTQDNLSLDVLSVPQQTVLDRLIRQELAQFRYHSRRHWALTQRQWRGLPLVNDSTNQVIAPLEWLWQGLYRWQARPALPGVMVAAPSSPLSPPPPIQQWLEQTTTSLAHAPVLAATVVKSRQISSQLIDSLLRSASPTALQHRGAVLRQKLTHGFGLTREAPDVSADPFALTALIQAAIAYFFGSRSPLPSPSPNTTTLTGSAPPSPWLQWDELFAELPQPSLYQPLLAQTPSSPSVLVQNRP
ncbi:MAG: hypothetical protein RLZZ568_1075, partial [Cyanobacteriota bacterium]